MVAKRGRHRAETGFPAQLRVQPRRIDDVVAVAAAGTSGEYRCEVDVADPQGREIGSQVGGLAEPERRPELNPIGGPGVIERS